MNLGKKYQDNKKCYDNGEYLENLVKKPKLSKTAKLSTIIYMGSYVIIVASLYFYEGISWISNVCLSVGTGLITGLVIYILTNVKNTNYIRTELCVVESRKAIKSFESIHPLLIEYNKKHETEKNKLEKSEHLEYFIRVLPYVTDFLEACIEALPGYKNCNSLSHEEFTKYIDSLPKHLNTLQKYKEMCFINQHMSYDQYHEFVRYLMEVQFLYAFLKEHSIEKEIELLYARVNPL